MVVFVYPIRILFIKGKTRTRNEKMKDNVEQKETIIRNLDEGKHGQDKRLL